MKLISETNALIRLARIREQFAADIRSGYEHRAKPCSLCESPGKCCVDEHFVNVRISRLEAVAIARVVEEFSDEHRARVIDRIESTIEKYSLIDGRDDEFKTYSCPLFETGKGCLVHATAKPLPCIAHACYENEKDLPPDELLIERELTVEKLNKKVYGKDKPLLPLPVAMRRHLVR